MKILFKGGQWNNAEDEVLKAAVMKYGKNNWGRIASLITRKTADQCKLRYEEWLDPTINRGEWTKAEEETLLELRELGHEWRVISTQLPGRTPSQCLEHYTLLVDRARGEAAGGEVPATGVRPIQFSEHDGTWESKPARADAVDIEGYERDMIDAARGRLANKKGKKEIRKLRERQVEEAKHRAQLQKERELREAGIGIAPSTQRDATPVSIHVDDLDPVKARKRSRVIAAAAVPSVDGTVPAEQEQNVADDTTVTQMQLRRALEERAKTFAAFGVDQPAALDGNQQHQLVVAASMQFRPSSRRMDAPPPHVPLDTGALRLPTLPTLKRPRKLSTASIPFAKLCGAPPLPIAALQPTSTVLFATATLSAHGEELVEGMMASIAAAGIRDGTVTLPTHHTPSRASDQVRPSELPQQRLCIEPADLTPDDDRMVPSVLVAEEMQKTPSRSEIQEAVVGKLLRAVTADATVWEYSRLEAHLRALHDLSVAIESAVAAFPSAGFVAEPYPIFSPLYGGAGAPRSAFGVKSVAETAAATIRDARDQCATAQGKAEQAALEAHVYEAVLAEERKEIARRGVKLSSE